MDRLRVIGGTSLTGAVRIDGAKNAALPILAATILGDSPSIIRNVPPLSDVKTMLSILESLGAVCSFDMENNVITVDPTTINNYTAPYDLVRKMRGSICVLGPLIGKFGKGTVSFPGGCVIGQRPIDLHLKGLRALNVSMNINHGYIEASTDDLRGNVVFLGGRFGSSVLATANIMLAAVKAKGTTVIESAACEPELVDLANFLKAMGAKIDHAGAHSITIEGVQNLDGVDYTVIPDRIEAGTYILAGAITRSKVTIENIIKEHLWALNDILTHSGVLIETKDNSITVDARSGIFKPLDITTLPYPGFPTDLQAQMMAFMISVKGISVITEKIFPDRFMHIAELNRMAADISLEHATAIIKGGTPLSGAPLMASDLRASAALVLAGLIAQGETVINRIYHLDRGYYKMEEKLRSLGAQIERIPE
ncbi:MAG: UDP-N-acetylglucosamine 1-carboxyvinyltransferase [Candidatus Auribacterota bacterium]|jgi:UDP-N-acetylglucosamine 1-carboxyvinyltransferase|nr:UDP-N-acetylglucosamine 1-carboxyvinyltransferase [Candidatus Auribacterota bacterium]